jgi:hypothetical protein
MGLLASSSNLMRCGQSSLIALTFCHADALLSYHFRLNFWNISFSDLLTYQVGCLLLKCATAGWQWRLQISHGCTRQSNCCVAASACLEINRPVDHFVIM